MPKRESPISRKEGWGFLLTSHGRKRRGVQPKNISFQVVTMVEANIKKDLSGRILVPFHYGPLLAAKMRYIPI